jgi:hypothetical protein
MKSFATLDEIRFCRTAFQSRFPNSDQNRSGTLIRARPELYSANRERAARESGSLPKRTHQYPLNARGARAAFQRWRDRMPQTGVRPTARTWLTDVFGSRCAWRKARYLSALRLPPPISKCASPARAYAMRHRGRPEHSPHKEWACTQVTEFYNPACLHNSSTLRSTSGLIAITSGHGRVKPSPGHFRVASIPIFDP